MRIAIVVSPHAGQLKACLYAMLLLFFGSATAAPPPALNVDGLENGIRLNEHFEVWHDESGNSDLAGATSALSAGKFGPLQSRDSTGLQPGTFWSHFALHNRANKAITLHLEYVDHQLISLAAFQRPQDDTPFRQVAELALNAPFSERLVPHHRFVVPVTIGPGAIHEFLFRFGTEGHGFIFPNLRIWSPGNLRQSQAAELAINGFLTGSLVLMTIIVVVGGLATGNSMFYAYSIYALTKITLWPTIFGFTHQFFLQNNFHWRLMSLNAALTLIAGIWFARLFLQTRRHIPRLDYVLMAVLANACLLLIAALLKLTTLSVITATLALLMSPIMAVAGLIRWRQGSGGAMVFTLAWTFLMLGLFCQALRDLGFVAHNFLNYYWPSVASHTEMVVIVAAIGISLMELRRKKDFAELRYREQLERTKVELEQMVSDRTRELEQEKMAAEYEARTDALTGINNRRSFLTQADALFERCRHRGDAFNLIMMDIDHFKKVNDSYGHKVGDIALQAFVETIKAQIRDDDIFGRLGGEEFALLVSGSTQSVVATAERLRIAVSRRVIDTDKGPLHITTSVGIANLKQDTSVEQLMVRADEALYQAKHNGRNQVVLADMASADYSHWLSTSESSSGA